MGTQAELFRGTQTYTISANTEIQSRLAAIHVIDASAGSLSVALEDARKVFGGTGYPVFRIVTPSGLANAFAITDHDGGSLITATAASKVYTFALLDDSTAAGTWSHVETDLNSTGAPPATIFPTTLGGTDFGREPWKFDFTTDSWSKGANDSTTFFDRSGGFPINNNGYCVDGASTATGDHEEYDPETWTIKTDSPTGKRETTGDQISGSDQAVLFGASTNADSLEVHRYDLSDDAWTALTNQPNKNHLHTCELVGTTIYYAGGTYSYVSGKAGVTDNVAYNPTADSHTSKTVMTRDTYDHASARDYQDDIYYYGGRATNGSTPYDEAEVYDVSGDSWSTATVHPNGEMTRGACWHIDANNRNYTCGGESATDPDATYEHVTLTDSYTVKTAHGAASANGRGFTNTSQALNG